MVSWTEGEWNGDHPVEPDVEYLWLLIDGYRRPVPKTFDSIDFTLRSHMAARKSVGEDSPPRWWWAPLEEPVNLPEDYRRSSRVQED